MPQKPLVYPQILLAPVGDLYELREEAHYSFGEQTIIVPVGYRYNGANVPKAFWFEIGSPFDPRFMPAALPHDRCYTTHEQPKEWVDELFLEVLLASGVSHWKAWLMYQAVRDFGQPLWDA